MALTLCCLLGQYVIEVRLLALETTGGRFLEPFGRAPVGFHLWHYFTCSLKNYSLLFLWCNNHDRLR